MSPRRPVQRPHRALLGGLTAGLLVLGSSGCGGDDAAAEDVDMADSSSVASSEEADSSRTGALGSRDDAVVALSAATGADGGSWEGDLLTLEFSVGSSADPGAMVNCSAVTRLLADGERAVLAYPDGDLDCEDSRHE